MKFIEVTAEQCNSQGILPQQGQQRVELRISSDLVGGIHEREVWLKDQHILNVGGTYYTNISVADHVVLDEIT